jgi:simple sugar transport system ATP-binding protein
MADLPNALDLEGVTKRFGPVRALADAALHVRAGTVHALLGENGAGKTTLMRIAFGLEHPDNGVIRVRGARRTLHTPRDALAAGIGMVQQHFSLVPAMTVAENIALGGHGRYDVASARARVRDLSLATGLAADPDAIASTLPVSAQQRVEILKALSRSIRVLILDEPTAVLAPTDAQALLAWARGFATSDNAVVLITHKLQEALAVADDVTVLREGRVVLQSPASSVDPDAIALAMLGGSRDPLHARGDATASGTVASPLVGDVVARIVGATLAGRGGVPLLRDVDLTIHAGEIIGVAAVEGNGERELLRVLSGRMRPASGSVELPERIAFIPQDRHAEAIAEALSLTENVALRGAGSRRGWMSWSAMREETTGALEAYRVRTDGPDARASTLSGGNQQRLVLARELLPDPRLVVADQPTRGLDVRATADVHDRLRAASARGAAVVVHSSDLDEVLALADRIVVAGGGRLREVVGDRERIGRAMLGLGE